MKTKAHILVVEDNALIYKRIKAELITAHYTVDEYTPSVEEAIGRINKKRPDLALLDIDLQGDQTGIDLGRLLKDDYYIPFIYMTDYEDDQTFYEALQSKHNDFIIKDYLDAKSIVNTKPHLDTKKIIRSIQTVLAHYQETSSPIFGEAIKGYTNYVNKTKELGKDDISEVGILLSDIIYFTTNSTELDDEKTKNNKKDTYKKLERNNARFYTWKEKSYITPNNLSKIFAKLPKNFARISEDYIVNMHPDYLDGRINGKQIKINGVVYTISDTYRAEVKKRYDLLYRDFR